MIKFQTLAIIFVLLVVPVTMLLTYYIDSQIDTIALQNSYDTKLLNATYDAIIAFQLNTINNNGYSTNAEALRRDINASVKTFTTSLANNFGVGGYGANNILPYIPAVLYTLYDGYYIYAPIPNTTIDESDGQLKTTYQHTLKPYVYYTARYYKAGGQTDIVVNYSLDNYIVVYGKLNGTYYSKAGYLTYWDKYNGVSLSGDARNYKNESQSVFSGDFIKQLEEIQVKDIVVEVNKSGVKTAKDLTVSEKDNQYYEFRNINDKIFKVSKDNDPEVKTSTFCEHKNLIIKKSIEANLNSAINNYTKQSEGMGTTYDYKMPILSSTEWDKILSNVSITAFMQGLRVGLKTYNNYMIVSSTGNYLYVDPEELYFVTTDRTTNKYDSYYHRINCPLLVEELSKGHSIEGYKNTDFKGVYKKIKIGTVEEEKYIYFGYDEATNNYPKGPVLACYECIVSSKVGGIVVDNADRDIDSNGVKRGREYATSDTNKDNLITFVTKFDGKSSRTLYQSQLISLRNAYYNALFKERYKQVKVSSYVNKAS